MGYQLDPGEFVPLPPDREAHWRYYVEAEVRTHHPWLTKPCTELLNEIDRLRKQLSESESARKALEAAVKRVIEATGISLDYPSGDLADELSNVMQAYVVERQNDVTELRQQLAKAQKQPPGTPEGMKVKRLISQQIWDGAWKHSFYRAEVEPLESPQEESHE
jgi:hypothetical protein